MALTHRVTLLNGALFATMVAVLGAAGLVRSVDFRAEPGLSVVRGALAHAFENHYDETFPAKRMGVNLWAAVDYGLFREGLPGVIVGKDGWLYTDEEFKLDNDSATLVRRNLALIDWVKRELERQHVALVVAVVPAKARIYPEYLGSRQPPALRQMLYPQMISQLRASGVNTVDLREPLQDGKRRNATYLRTDTHWTPFGARLSAQAIAGQTGHVADASGNFHTIAGAPAMHRGDLFNFLPLDPWFGWMLPAPDVLTPVQTAADAKGNDLLGDAPRAQVALVGTSYSAEANWNFAGALEQALHTDVLNYARDGNGPFEPMLAYLHSADFRASPPRLVIWEVPERYMPLPQTALAAYHLPPDAWIPRVAASAATGGNPAREGGSTSHVQSNL